MTGSAWSRRFFFALTSVVTLGALAQGCAADEPSTPPAPATSSSGGATGVGGMGATTGSGQGGDGGEDPGPCGTDCSQISTGNPCLEAVCNTGQHPGPVNQCVVVPADGNACEDGEFCTADDTCLDGVCVGGPPNDCGLNPMECEQVVCDEQADMCTTEPVPNGDPCESDDLCQIGTTCTNGICGGGMTENCFLEPTPNECFNSVCNPTNGMCEPVPGNDGFNCVDLNDLCTEGKTCDAGACTGGSPKDCTGVAAECEVGVCDTNTGQCMAQPSMQGDPCSAAGDQCNPGFCDNTGTCVPQQATDGTMCDNGDACSTMDTCQSGICSAGSPVTVCSQTPDGCCPSTCTAANDLDCACSIDQLATPYNTNNGSAGNMFDVNALANIEVQGVEVSVGTATATVEVYHRPGTHVGFENSSVGWTLAGSAMVTGAGVDVPTPVPLALSIPIAAGQTHAFYVTTTTSAIDYTNGTSVGTVLASNADLEILEGVGKSYPFGSTFTTRNWNGTLIYEVCGQ